MHQTVRMILALALVAGCGGTKKGDGAGASSVGGSGSGGDLDVEGGALDVGDGGLPADAAPPPAPVTFVLTNTADEDLVLNMDKGWQPILFAYSGTPPNAKSILMFPTYCTMSCDTPEEERCPVCEEPERVVDIKAAQQLDYVKPGESREVPWDLVVYEDQRTRGRNAKGRRVRCKCWTTAEAPPETYTVKACGLRLTQTAKASSKYQCVEGSMTLPVEEPIRVELEFPEPAAK